MAVVVRRRKLSSANGTREGRERERSLFEIFFNFERYYVRFDVFMRFNRFGHDLLQEKIFLDA